MACYPNFKCCIHCLDWFDIRLAYESERPNDFTRPHLCEFCDQYVCPHCGNCACEMSDETRRAIKAMENTYDRYLGVQGMDRGRKEQK